MLPATTDKDGHEQTFFDGIDTCLPGLAARLGEEEKRCRGCGRSWRRLRRIKERGGQREGSEQRGGTFAGGMERCADWGARCRSSHLGEGARRDLAGRLEKLQQAEKALNLARCHAASDGGWPRKEPREGLTKPAALTVVSPGQKFAVRVVAQRFEVTRSG